METLSIGNENFTVEPLFEDDFADLDNWLIESNGSVEAKDNKLCWTCETGGHMGTIWCRRRFEGPTVVSYDVTTVSGNDNINFIFYGNTENDDLIETSASRTGAYAEYHGMRNYIITYLTNGEQEWRIRFRKCPGFNLVAEGHAQRPVEKGITRHIGYVFDAAGAMRLYVDGDLLQEYVDPETPHRSGYHGFRTWDSVLQYANFKVCGIR